MYYYGTRTVCCPKDAWGGGRHPTTAVAIIMMMLMLIALSTSVVFLVTQNIHDHVLRHGMSRMMVTTTTKPLPSRTEVMNHHNDTETMTLTQLSLSSLQFHDDDLPKENNTITIIARRRRHNHHHHPSYSSHRLCHRDEIRHGRWIPWKLPKAPYVPNNIKLRCYPLERYHQEWHTWQWMPYAVITKANEATQLDETKIDQTTTRSTQNHNESMTINSSSPSIHNHRTHHYYNYNIINNSCTLVPWDAKLFCHVLPKHAVVAIVGDSLSWEQYSSLIQLLGRPSHQTYQHTSKRLQQSHVEIVCRGKLYHNKNIRLLFRRDDLLQHLNQVIGMDDEYDYEYDYPLQDATNTTTTGDQHHQKNHTRLFPNVLILNRGAHYTNDSTLLYDMEHLVLPQLTKWQTSCHRRQQQQQRNSSSVVTSIIAPSFCHLFWRTTVPGHPSCWKFSKPITTSTTEALAILRESSPPLPQQNWNTTISLQENIEAYIGNPESYDNLERQWNYHWYDYQHQNQLLLHLLAEYMMISSSSSTRSSTDDSSNHFYPYDRITTTNVSTTNANYNRSQFHHNNNHVTKMNTRIGFDIIDAYEINILRPDEHRWNHNQSDCLHNCYPGKMDLYNQLLLHYLMQRQQQQQQQPQDDEE